MCKTTEKVKASIHCAFLSGNRLLTEVKGEDPRHPSAGRLAFYSLSMTDSLQGKGSELVHLPVSTVSAALTS